MTRSTRQTTKRRRATLFGRRYAFALRHVPQCFDDARAQEKGARDAEEISRQRKEIAAFVRRLDNMAELPYPSTGDCLYCQMQYQEPVVQLVSAAADTLRNREELRRLAHRTQWSVTAP
jgi:hypothetical protein